MRHVPHLYLPPPWEGEKLPAPTTTRSHLNTVLRVPSGSPVTYTDGGGRAGTGTWLGASIARGDERSTARPERRLTMAVAPPKGKDRQRSIVEKLQELGVSELVWVATERTQVPPPNSTRSVAWAVGALEQSAGSWLMSIAADDVAGVIASAAGSVRMVDPSGTDVLEWPGGSSLTVLVGPEGGFTDAERSVAPVARLGGTILRTETAAVVSASRALID